MFFLIHSIFQSFGYIAIIVLTIIFVYNSSMQPSLLLKKQCKSVICFALHGELTYYHIKNIWFTFIVVVANIICISIYNAFIFVYSSDSDLITIRISKIFCVVYDALPLCIFLRISWSTLSAMTTTSSVSLDSEPEPNQVLCLNLKLLNAAFNWSLGWAASVDLLTRGVLFNGRYW